MRAVALDPIIVLHWLWYISDALGFIDCSRRLFGPSAQGPITYFKRPKDKSLVAWRSPKSVWLRLGLAVGLAQDACRCGAGEANLQFQIREKTDAQMDMPAPSPALSVRSLPNY